MRFSRFITASFIALTAACASSGSTGSSNSAAAPENSEGPKTSTNSKATLLTSLEIENAKVPTAFEAVDRLRHKWLKDLTTDAAVTVYMNNQKLNGGSAEELKTIPASDVLRLEYIKGNDAMMKFGQEAKGGAILVFRKQ